MRVLITCFLMFGIGLLATAGATNADDIEFPTTELWIETDDARHPFTIEVAETRQQLSRGLMFRSELAPDAGMMFDYDPPQHVSMWMKNTLIPLDMLFVRENGVIGRIAAWTTPLSLESIRSGEPVRAVIELKGGLTGQLGIKVGHKIIHPIFDE